VLDGEWISTSNDVFREDPSVAFFEKAWRVVGTRFDELSFTFLMKAEVFEFVEYTRLS
jgi:hypothetical protein